MHKFVEDKECMTTKESRSHDRERETNRMVEIEFLLVGRACSSKDVVEQVLVVQCVYSITSDSTHH